MILKASQRGDGRQLGRYLLTMGENEHIEVHEVRGFMADDVVGALSEAEAVSKGTKCRQHLFSVSLNPPPRESVRIEVFEKALDAIEECNGLAGQPRVVVFHEKEGRRHCHAVWSRIDPETMTARPLPFFKNRLREVSKQLYQENGWQMPRGLMDSRARDPRNFSLAEWQQARREGRNAGQDKCTIQECWAVSDSRAAFIKALEERGFYLARGDRRSHVALHFDGGEPISIARAVGKPVKEIRIRLGEGDDLPSVEQTRRRVAGEIAPRLKGYIGEARAAARAELAPLEQQRQSMAAKHQSERLALDAGQKARQEDETRLRAARLRTGLAGLWDRLKGEYARLRKQNEAEAFFALQRDREQRHAVIQAQLRERQALHAQIKQARQRHTDQLRGLHKDAAHYRLMQRGKVPEMRSAFDKPAAPRERSQEPPHASPSKTPSPQDRLASFREAAARPPGEQLPQRPKIPSPQDRLARLKRGDRDPDKGPEISRD